MARLTAKGRARIPKSKFAGPGRTFPIEDRSHAIAAERLAPRSEKAGNITAGEEASIEAKAARVLDEKPHRVKGTQGHFQYKG